MFRQIYVKIIHIIILKITYYLNILLCLLFIYFYTSRYTVFSFTHIHVFKR